MILTDQMEEKQLNFNRPLLSVRRGSSLNAPTNNKRKDIGSQASLPPLPFYRSELKSGPIRNPGVVPFKWERMPGRPKDEKIESKSQKGTLAYRPPTPKLPPGRTANDMQKQTSEVPRDSPTSSSRYQAEINASRSQQEKVFSEGSEKEEEDRAISSSEDESLAFVDARETLSRSESFFNCSVSGVSGIDGPESLGAYSDPQTQDFMMGRFLPAAKAMASETPPFACRRLPVAREEARPAPKMIKWKQSPKEYTIPDTLPHNINGEDRDESDDESDGAEDISVKLCGLLPRFCMLSPIPGMRDHVEVISSVRSVRTRPAYAGACKDVEKKVGPKLNRGGIKRSTYQLAHVPLKEPSQTGHLGRNGVMRETDASPQLFIDREKRLLGLPGSQTATHLDTEGKTNLANPVIEKTVYVDSERMVESRHSNSSSSESRGRNPSVDYSLQDMKSLSSKSSDTTDFSAATTSEKSCKDVAEGLKNLKKQDHDFINVIVDVKQTPKPDVKTIKNSNTCNSPLALTPLLPKSPSESWLSRTLPSMGSRNPSSKSYLVNHAFRSSPVDPKRERLLHPSNVQKMYLQSAGELAPIFEN